MVLDFLQNMQDPYANLLFVRERQTKFLPQQNITFSEKHMQQTQILRDKNAKP